MTDQPPKNQLELIMSLRGVHDAQLANWIGVQRSSVHQWKSGNSNARENTLKLICQALKCSPSDYLGFTLPYQGLQNRYQDLFMAATNYGEYDSQHILRIAMQIRALYKKTTNFELWLRGLADALYKMEQVKQLHTRKKKHQELQTQLSLFDNLHNSV